DPHYVAVALQPDGRIVVAGDTQVVVSKTRRSTTTRQDLLVARLNPNGTLDTTFNGTGQVKLDLPQGSIYARGVAVQADGKIVVGGGTGVDNTAGLGFLAARFNADGSLDHSFGPNGQGYVVRATGHADTMTVDPAGDILIGGNDVVPSAPSTNRPAVVRYTPAGLPDPTFGTNGEVLINAPSSTGGLEVEGIGLQPDGHVVVSGLFGQSSYNYAGVARLDADGSLDTTFATNGFFLDSTMFHAYGLAVEGDGSILIAGQGAAGLNQGSFVVDRVLAGGQSTDPTFGNGGQALAPFAGQTFARPQAVVIGPDGKITVAGAVNYYSGGAYIYGFGTARLLD
ncbi:MAG: hypothetical protein LC745_03815, partial [Planctomycetia bacterium]|nr:hypothetical protein [Planctomycetia bacterium]